MGILNYIEMVRNGEYGEYGEVVSEIPEKALLASPTFHMRDGRTLVAYDNGVLNLVDKCTSSLAKKI